MEDISRELEKEITRLKPAPYKKKIKKRILMVDDFGGIRPAEHLKVLVYIFGAVSLISVLAATGLYYFVLTRNLENKQLKREVIELENKVAGLITQREVLMARLVISGKEPGIETPSSSVLGTVEKKAEIKEKIELERVETVQEIATESTIKALAAQDQSTIAEKISLNQAQESAEGQATEESTALSRQMVALEKFMVIQDGVKGDLLVRFDIRNLSDKSGGVSGRIFTILKPENSSQEEWLVVPSAKLEKGVPAEHKKGQYFSISHYKPIKFRIENQAGPDFFKKAAIYIFNEAGDLMFENHIDITGEEPS